MSPGRKFLLVFLGVCLGIGFTVGAVLGIRQYSPELWAKTAAYFMGLSRTPDSGQSEAMGIDMTAVRGMIQEILTSDQGKAVVAEFIGSQSQDMYKTILEEAVRSPEFRKALADALDIFLKSQEGKDLIRRIVQETITP